MKTVIAATDFSDNSRHAVQYAGHLAASLSATLVLYHAVESAAITTESTVTSFGESYQDEPLAKLEEWTEELLAYTNHAITIQPILRWGNAALEMNRLCHEKKPFAVVMAATKKNSFDRILTGSRTLNISQYCHVPLLLMPEGAAFEGLHTIAIASDFEDVVESMPLQELTHWIKNFPAKLEVVNVSPAGGMKGKSLSEAVAMETHFHEFIPRFRYITNGDIAQGIYEYQKEHRPDILIMVPKKRGWFHKSLCKELMLHPVLPLLIMPKYLQPGCCE